jgi:hypothetical protein
MDDHGERGQATSHGAAALSHRGRRAARRVVAPHRQRGAREECGCSPGENPLVAVQHTPWDGGMAVSASVTAATREELAGLSQRYGPLFAEIRGDLDQLVDDGRMRRALRLSDVTGQHLNATTMPAFFIGDLDAGIVLVHLNPKQPNYDAAQPPNARRSTIPEARS